MSFDLFPAVDLRGGRCVQLVGGVPGSEVVSLDDPLAQAVRWVEMGTRVLHIIDLDGAIQGVRINGPLLDLGVDRVILGTAALARPEMVMELAADFGPERVMVALDVRRGKVTTEGWQRDLEKGAVELGLLFQEKGAGSILFTNIDTEGRLRGIDPEPTRRLVEAVDIPVVAAGGVSTVEDVLVLRDAGAAGAVVGTAIYTGKLNFKKALSALRS
jgi:phosphoribosylformimino-5-aminoimidazole carboxamide ribotide isomerase